MCHDFAYSVLSTKRHTLSMSGNLLHDFFRTVLWFFQAIKCSPEILVFIK